MGMEFLENTLKDVSLINKDLQKATKDIFKLGQSIRKNWFEIAHIVAKVDSTECYKDDGFNNVHEYVNRVFGLKKSASYALLTIGKEYLREIVNTSGKTIGYGTNLVPEHTEDFSKSQVEKMLPLGHEKAEELVSNLVITPDMSVREIIKVVKNETTNKEVESEEPEEPEESEEPEEPEEPQESEEPEVCRVVWDTDNTMYEVPVRILDKYKVNN